MGVTSGSSSHESDKGSDLGRGTGNPLHPRRDPIEVDSRGGRNMVQMGEWFATLSRPSYSTSPNRLGMGAFNACSLVIQLPKFVRRRSLSCGFQREKCGFRCDRNRASSSNRTLLPCKVVRTPVRDALSTFRGKEAGTKKAE